MNEIICKNCKLELRMKDGKYVHYWNFQYRTDFCPSLKRTKAEVEEYGHNPE